MSVIYDTIIIGGGPAGAAAGVYAARKKLRTLLITEFFGGQSIVASDIENWIGTKHITGYELSKSLEDHVRAQEDIEIKISEKAEKVKKIKNGFLVKTNKGDYKTKTVIMATGGRRRKLGVPGEDKFEGKEVSYCATCDGPIFKEKKVAVVGGGNSGLEAVVDLIPYANKIYLLVRGDTMKGDPLTQKEVKNSSKTTILYNAAVKEIIGENSVEKIICVDSTDGEKKEVLVDGVFVEIGSEPNAEIASDLVETNKWGEIVTDARTGKTSVEGIFAAGDVTSDSYKQNNIAAGDAIKAALSAYNYILKLRKKA